MTPALVFVRDDLVQVGWTEDGEADLARRFYLVAEAADGRRWAHDFSVVAGRWEVDAAVARLEALARRVERAVAAGRALDGDHWGEIDAAYGSAAYQRLDAIGYHRAQEVLRAVDAGERVSCEMEEEARAIVAWA